jgi:hypothetical protein
VDVKTKDDTLLSYMPRQYAINDPSIPANYCAIFDILHPDWALE